MLNDVLKYLKFGLSVVPLRAKSKVPHMKDWQKTPIASEEQARKWWLSNPYDGAGLFIGGPLAGGYKLVGVDFDCNHGAKIDDLKLFPRTVTTRTRHGFHLYLRMRGDDPRTPRTALIPTFEGKAHNQAPAYLYTDSRQFVAPPTIVSVDEHWKPIAPYEYGFLSDVGGELSFWDCELAICPDWFFEDSATLAVAPTSLVATVQQFAKPPAQANQHQTTQAYQPNSRHAMFIATATAMRKKGRSEQEIITELHRRNLEDCNPPKPEAEQELANVVKWVMEQVKPSVNQYVTQDIQEQQEYIIPLGHLGTDYYYTTSSNKQIITVSRSGHETALGDMMPMTYWEARYGGPRGGVDWKRAAMELMAACREVGIFDMQKLRGVGCWMDDGRFVIHLGDQLIVDGEYMSLARIPSRYIYALSESEKAPEGTLSVAECKKLIDACAAPNWADKSSAILLAGMLAVMRVGGALPWRPMGWLTGASGSGKSTIMERLIMPMLGESALYTLGNTTEAGIRQQLGQSSRPVIFDEAEINDKRSASRMKGVLELIRQSSSSGGGRIYKGTPDGKGINFKVNSCFLLSSIRFNLSEEADKNRFTLFELERAIESKWPEVSRKLALINEEYGDKLYGRAVQMFPVTMKSRLVLEDVVAEKADRRTSQQYGALLAGYWTLVSDEVISQAQAEELVGRLSMFASKQGDSEGDEVEALHHLLESQINYRDNGVSESKSVGSMVDYLVKLGRPDNMVLNLISSGLDICDGALMVANRHPWLSKVYDNTKWEGGVWATALRRLPGAKKGRHNYGMVSRKHCVIIPLAVLGSYDA